MSGTDKTLETRFQLIFADKVIPEADQEHCCLSY